MAHYIIGDIHGCYDTLMQLIEKIQFNPDKDVMYCVGDLVGRGPKPLEVLRYVLQTPSVFHVLGNHDIWCMAVSYGGHKKYPSEFSTLFQTEQDKALLEQWRNKAKLCIRNEALKIVITHAGIPPQWNVEQTESYAKTFCHAIQQPNFKDILEAMEGEEPHCWQKDLTGYDSLRYIVNALTRMRFCDEKGCLDFKEKDVIESKHKHLKPWFDWPNQLDGYRLFYGHWAALGGDCFAKNIYATDTGCVYGGYLTAYQVLDATSEPQSFYVASVDKI